MKSVRMFDVIIANRIWSLAFAAGLCGSSFLTAQQPNVTTQSVPSGSEATINVGDVTVRVMVKSSEKTENPIGTALYRLSRIGGTCTRLCVTPTSRTGSPDLSRDGTKVAFDGWQKHQDERVGDAHIYTFDLSTPNQINHLHSGAMPSWSLDGSQLTFSQYSGGRVSVMNEDATEVEVLDSNGWSSEWSPDGAKIAYTTRAAGYADIIVCDVKTDTKTSLFPNKDMRFVQWGITWSPDSKRLCAYGRDKKGELMLLVVHVEGEYRERRIISWSIPSQLMETVETPIAWGDDGTRVMFAATKPGTGLDRLYTLDVDGDSPPQEVLGLPEGINCSEPFWHPDGTIVFVGSP